MTRNSALAIAIAAGAALSAGEAQADVWVPGHYGADGLWIPEHYGPGPALMPPGPIAEPYAVWMPGWLDQGGFWHPGHWES